MLWSDFELSGRAIAFIVRAYLLETFSLIIDRSVFPPIVLEVVRYLQDNCFEAFVVGGCLRDVCMGLLPKDWDIATDATPPQMLQIFSHHHFKVLCIGERFGTLKVFKDDEYVEVTTYRTEGEYSNFRSPKKVVFVNELKQDLIRRDFTMNALAYNPFQCDGVIDYFCGIEHIQQKRIICVGDAQKRFSEDALRMLRALRFAATKGFQIDHDAQQAMIKCSPLLQYLSYERITQELDLWFLGDYASEVLCEFAWILRSILGEDFSKIDIKFVAFVWKQSPPYLILRWAVLLLYCPRADLLLKKLKYSKRDCQQIGKIVQSYSCIQKVQKVFLKRYLYKLGAENLRIILHIKRWESLYKHDIIKEQYWQKAYMTYKEIIVQQECYQLRQLQISGKELLAMGILPIQIKALLEEILFAVFDGKVSNQPDALLDYACNVASQYQLKKK